MFQVGGSMLGDRTEQDAGKKEPIPKAWKARGDLRRSLSGSRLSPTGFIRIHKADTKPLLTYGGNTAT